MQERENPGRGRLGNLITVLELLATITTFLVVVSPPKDVMRNQLSGWFFFGLLSVLQGIQHLCCMRAVWSALVLQGLPDLGRGGSHAAVSVFPLIKRSSTFLETIFFPLSGRVGISPLAAFL